MKLLLHCLVIGLCTTTSLASVETYPPQGFFSKDDATQITWAHGVNSKAKLEVALKDPSVKMLEADVVMGFVKGAPTTPTAIMAHPPVLFSDLSLLTFLEEVIAHNKGLNLSERKGIKLDFKGEFAAVRGMEFLQRMHTEIEFPVWNNADVLPGPVGALPIIGVNGKKLIMLHNNFPRPMLTLSLGWTTRFVEGGRYSKEQLNAMLNLLAEANSTAPITFPMRAKLALGAVNDIKVLLDESRIQFTSPSVTLWEGKSDSKVSQEELTEFVNKIGKDRVFVDLPYSFGEGDGGDGTEGPGDGTDKTNPAGDDESTTTEGSGPGLKSKTSNFVVAGFALMFHLV